MSDTCNWFCQDRAAQKALRGYLEDAKQLTENECMTLLATLDLYTDADACDERYRSAALDRSVVTDGVCEIDTQAVVSASDEGAYVMAWVWVPREDVEGTECDDG